MYIRLIAIALAFSVCLTVNAAPDRRIPNRAERESTLLVDLLESCRRMLEWQTAVCEDTKRLEAALAQSNTLLPEHKETLRKLAARQNNIINEANKAIARLEMDNAVAFPEVFNRLRDDMKQIHARLVRGDVGVKTLEIEVDAVETLQEIVDAFRPR
jgi:hypothetical protein